MIQVQAVFTDGTAIYYVVPSRLFTGKVLVKCEVNNDTLEVISSCSCKEDRCRHALDGLPIYWFWNSRKEFKNLEYKKGSIALSPNWKLIDNPLDKLEESIEGGNKYAAERA